ncbi:MAG: hypothetical protein GYB64_11210 [Chloroflexi bacterium]|nr:hypothetical protein [Chloroflexota bacterium]
MADEDFDDEAPLTVLAETERYAILTGEDADGERIYNIELGAVTLHLFIDEWRELLELIDEAREED